MTTFARTVERLRESSTEMRSNVNLRASYCIDTPELEAKIVFARHLYDDVEGATLLMRRLAELGVEAPAAIEPSRTAVLSTSDKLAHFERTDEALLTKIDEDRQSTSLQDEPTLRVLTDLANMLKRRRDESRSARQLIATLFEGPSENTAAANHPARDRRFRTNAAPVPPPATERFDRSAVIALLHVNLTDLEIATIEACCRLILDFPMMPWEFVRDMARQCWDEARHAELFRSQLLSRGGTIGQYRVSHVLWEMAEGQDLAVRLAIHQRIGEWVGVDGALHHARALAADGDSTIASIFDFIAADEITHVGFGNKWIQRLAGSEEAVRETVERAEKRRSEFGKSNEGPLIFPFHRRPCEQAGFSPAEIEQLEQRFAAHGSIFRRKEEQ